MVSAVRCQVSAPECLESFAGGGRSDTVSLLPNGLAIEVSATREKGPAGDPPLNPVGREVEMFGQNLRKQEMRLLVRQGPDCFHPANLLLTSNGNSEFADSFSEPCVA